VKGRENLHSLMNYAFETWSGKPEQNKIILPDSKFHSKNNFYILSKLINRRLLHHHYHEQKNKMQQLRFKLSTNATVLAIKTPVAVFFGKVPKSSVIAVLPISVTK